MPLSGSRQEGPRTHDFGQRIRDNATKTCIRSDAMLDNA